MEEAGAPGRGGEEPWTSPSRVTKRVPGSPRARELDFRSQQSHAAERARGSSGREGSAHRAPPPAPQGTACKRVQLLQSRFSPDSGGRAPRPRPLPPPPEPRRGRPLLARGFAAHPPAGSSLRMALVRGPADPHARPSAKKLGSQVQKTHGRGSGAAGRGKTQGCRPPRSRR